MFSVALRNSPSCSRILPSLPLSSSRPLTSYAYRIHTPALSSCPIHSHTVRRKSTHAQPKAGATPPPPPSPSPNTATTSSALESPSSSIDASSQAENAVDDKNPIPLLDRPLGVKEPPSAEEKSWKERGSEFMDSEKQLEKRRALIKQASSGYFYDLHMTRRHGGKTWMAPKVLIRQEKALYFPDIVGHRLSNGEKAHTTAMCKGKITVVAMLTTKISESHARAYTSRLNEAYTTNPSYQYLQINLQENVLKSLLVNLFLSSLRSSIPTAQHPNYLVSRQNMDYVRDSLLMTNSRIGYVYLLDEDLKVRWGACADAKPEEEEALFRGVGVLLNRLNEGGKAKVGEEKSASGGKKKGGSK